MPDVDVEYSAVRRAKEEWSGVVEWVDGGSSGGSNQGTRGGSLD